jgi:hypothetical protein
VAIRSGVRVTGFEMSGGAVAVHTDQGEIRCDEVVIAAGPWVRDLWGMLDLPERIAVTGRDGVVHRDRPMWTYWALQEGVLEVDPHEFRDNRAAFPPVLHVDSDQPLYDDVDGGLITDRMWGIYYKADFTLTPTTATR